MDIVTLEIFQNNYVGDTDQKSCPFWPAETSSNINEVITAVLNFLLFFLQKDLAHTKRTKSAKSTKSTKSTKTQPSKSTKRK